MQIYIYIYIYIYTKVKEESCNSEFRALSDHQTSIYIYICCSSILSLVWFNFDGFPLFEIRYYI